MDKGNWIVKDVQDWVDPIFVPQCLPSQLKTCELLRARRCAFIGNIYCEEYKSFANHENLL